MELVPSEPGPREGWNRGRAVLAAGFAAVFLLAVGLRLLDVGVPVQTADWREADIAGIARNYHHEGMNLLLPRVDWRGDGPGYAEMEFPFLPWSMAVAYGWVGVREEAGRVVALALSLVAMVCFFRLAARRLPRAGALVACAFFVSNPLFVQISTSLRPDGWMFAAYLLAVLAFLRWLDGEEARWYLTALVATAVSILAKATAVHLGLLFVFLVFDRWGWAAVRRPRLWLFAAGSLAPALLWYAHARRLWLTYGNSLGISNESHWVGLDLFTRSEFLRGIARAEVDSVWMPAGILLFAFWLLLASPWRRYRFELFWLLAVAVFYLVTARTSGDSWATYYHVVSVPPAALLLGAAWSDIGRFPLGRRRAIQVALAAMTAAALMFGAGAAGWVGNGPRDGIKLALLCAGAGALLVGSTLIPAGSSREQPEPVRRFGLVAALVASVALSGAYVGEIQALYWRFESRGADPLLGCARDFAPYVPEGALIVASGGPCKDPTGYPVAFNKSYMFYWMDRKGFNLCREELSIVALESLAGRGARFFVAEKRDVASAPGLEADLRRSLAVVEECDSTWLFALPAEHLAADAATFRAGAQDATGRPGGHR